LNAPTAAPAATTTAMLTASGRCQPTSKIAEIPPSSPSSEPTDRSISPEMMTNTMPQASIPVIAICRSRFDRLRGVMKSPPVSWLNSTHSAAIAITSASTL